MIMWSKQLSLCGFVCNCLLLAVTEVALQFACVHYYFVLFPRAFSATCRLCDWLQCCPTGLRSNCKFRLGLHTLDLLCSAECWRTAVIHKQSVSVSCLISNTAAQVLADQNILPRHRRVHVNKRPNPQSLSHVSGFVKTDWAKHRYDVT